VKPFDVSKRRSKKIFVVGDVAFVPHPDRRSMYLRTHACVFVKACPACGAKVGEFCLDKGRPWAGTHYQRRQNWKDGLPKQKPLTIIFTPNGAT
jgi:hypothetical protein